MNAEKRFARAFVEAGERARSYDAVTTFDLGTELRNVNDSLFTRTLAAKGIETGIALKPMAIGEGSVLESAIDNVSSKLLARIRVFAGGTRSTHSVNVIAVFHRAIYTLEDGDKICDALSNNRISQHIENSENGGAGRDRTGGLRIAKNKRVLQVIDLSALNRGRPTAAHHTSV